MKKISIFAMVLGVIFAMESSFTSVKSSTTSSKDNLYWYKVNPADHSKVLAVYGFVSKASAKTSSSCDDSHTDICCRGYAVDPGYVIGDQTSGGTDTIKKSS